MWVESFEGDGDLKMPGSCRKFHQWWFHWRISDQRVAFSIITAHINRGDTQKKCFKKAPGTTHDGTGEKKKSRVETSWIGPCSGKNDKSSQADRIYMPIASISERWSDDERQSERLEADGQRGRRGGAQTSMSRTSIIGGGEMMRDSQSDGWMEQKTDDEVERGNKRGRTSERENRPRCQGGVNGGKWCLDDWRRRSPL